MGHILAGVVPDVARSSGSRNVRRRLVPIPAAVDPASPGSDVDDLFSDDGAVPAPPSGLAQLDPDNNKGVSLK